MCNLQNDAGILTLFVFLCCKDKFYVPVIEFMPQNCGINQTLYDFSEYLVPFIRRALLKNMLIWLRAVKIGQSLGTKKVSTTEFTHGRTTSCP